jgi:hypothetical protein
MKSKIQKILLRVSSKLKQHKINFAIVGSISLYLQGMSVNPHDIDIITNKIGIIKIEKLFRKYKKQGITSEKENLKKSVYFCHFAMFKINNVKIEILADTWAKNKKTKKIYRSNLKLKRFIVFKKQKIPIMPIEEELKAKEVIMWKPKRINKIRKFLKEKERSK